MQLLLYLCVCVCRSALHSTLLHGQYCTLTHSTVLCSTVRYCAALQVVELLLDQLHEDLNLVTQKLYTGEQHRTTPLLLPLLLLLLLSQLLLLLCTALFSSFRAPCLTMNCAPAIYSQSH